MSRIHDALERRESVRLRRTTFNPEETVEQVIREMVGLSKPRVARGFISDMSYSSIVCAPLYYDQPIVHYCRHCEISKSPQVVRWATEEGLIIPMMKTRYKDQPISVISPIASSPHISHQAMVALKAIWAKRENVGCYCYRCVELGIVDYRHLPKKQRNEVEERIIPKLANLPTEIRAVANELVEKAITAGMSSAILEVANQLEIMNDVCVAKSINALPQFRATVPSTLPNSVFSEELEVLTMNVGLAIPNGLPNIEYLEIIRDHQGVLAPLLMDASKGQIEIALKKCETINEEIAEIRQSKRLGLLRLGTRVYREDRTRLLNMAFGGAIGFATHGPVGAAVGGFAGAGLEHLARHLGGSHPRTGTIRSPNATPNLAKYFGKSVEAVHVWQMQDAIAETKGQ